MRVRARFLQNSLAATSVQYVPVRNVDAAMSWGSVGVTPPPEDQQLFEHGVIKCCWKLWSWRRFGSSSRPQQRQRRRSPPSQRRQSQLTTFTERFLSLEEQRIEIDRRYCELQDVMVNSQRETNRMTAEGLIAVGEGLKLLAENLKK
ncbi:unnamed protein product [Colias eurytheme]|nr:unnamed protein product [Colias eurytheme]